MFDKGIEGDYGIFATVNKPSDFVTAPKKTIVEFEVPKEHLEVRPDMGYGGATDGDAYADVLQRHGGVHGSDVSLPFENIPRSWIKKIQVVDKK